MDSGRHDDGTVRWKFEEVVPRKMDILGRSGKRSPG